ncbi:MAG: NTP transferase domain-containing protein [Thermoleophilia bacterium]|nr:NTP transferase domain-containing protein [Thermoleophilia bacterium]
MNSLPLTVVVLAAGQGKRMRSDLPKVLHPVCGLPMLRHVLSAAESVAADRRVVVLGHRAEMVAPYVPASWLVALQDRPLGTGHALLAAESHILPGLVLVLPGDAPLLTGEVLRDFVETHRRSGASASVMTMVLDSPSGYGRILRDEEGWVAGIVEEGDATPEQREIKEVNAGVYVLPSSDTLALLRDIGTDNSQNEMYLTDVISALRAQGRKVSGVRLSDPTAAFGVNSREDLVVAEELMRRRQGKKHNGSPSDGSRSGETILQPRDSY